MRQEDPSFVVIQKSKLNLSKRIEKSYGILSEKGIDALLYSRFIILQFFSRIQVFADRNILYIATLLLTKITKAL